MAETQNEVQTSGKMTFMSWTEIIADYICEKTYSLPVPEKIMITKQEFKRELQLILEHNDPNVELMGLAYINDSEFDEPGYYIIFRDVNSKEDEEDDTFSIFVSTMLRTTFDRFLINSGFKKEANDESAEQNDNVSEEK